MMEQDIPQILEKLFLIVGFGVQHSIILMIWRNTISLIMREMVCVLAVAQKSTGLLPQEKI